jgi:hypothetical protein
MSKKAIGLFAAVMICLLPVAASAQLTIYTQDFESLVQADTGALGADGWLIFANVFSSTGAYLYGYGVFPAPNDPSNPAFCLIATGQGGAAQGAQQLVTFSDYANTDHGIGNIIETNVFQEMTVGAGDVGVTWNFQFDAKLGDLAGASTALAFIKTLDPSAGYYTSNFITADMTAIPDTWGTYTLEIGITADLVGQLIQIGFSNTATGYEGSGIFYDNVFWFQSGDLSAVPDASDLADASLRQNYPNPFNPLTRIDFSLEKGGMVDLTVYDLAGRLVATLHRGDLAAGEHHVTWDGRTNAGAMAAAGQYRYVLKTASGQVARSMTLLK